MRLGDKLDKSNKERKQRMISRQSMCSTTKGVVRAGQNQGAAKDTCHWPTTNHPHLSLDFLTLLLCEKKKRNSQRRRKFLPFTWKWKWNWKKIDLEGKGKRFNPMKF